MVKSNTSPNSSPSSMPDIFAYLDYRQFLQDYYLERKRASPVFSYKNFANKAGFKTKSFLKMVITGKKNLSDASMQKVAKAIKLDDKAASFFEDLVAYNQAKSLKARNQLLERLLARRAAGLGKLIQQAQHEFYSQWFHNTLRELLARVDFQVDSKRLGQMLFPPVAEKSIEKSLELMVRLGLIRKEGEGRYRPSDPIITTGDEVRSLAVKSFHLENFVLGARSMEACPPEFRDISCLVVGLSDRGILMFKQEIQAFRKRLLELAEGDKPCKRIYHVAFQMYPTTQEIA